MGYTIKTNIKQVNGDLRKWNVKVDKAVKREVLNAATTIQRMARGDAPVDRGTLRREIKFNHRGLTSTVWSGAKYGREVEEGRKPGRWPNMDSLQGWVKRKIKPANKRLKSITYLVARKIHDEGTDPQPYFEPAVNEYGPKFIRKIELILKRA